MDPIDVVLQAEGGYSNDPVDRGGATNFGVTQHTYSTYLGRPATIQDVKDMTVETAREIYERMYLTGPRIDTIPQPLQTLVLDMSVNHGPRNAIKMLQRVTNAAGFGPISVDGVLGPMTRASVLKGVAGMGNAFQNALVEERLHFYASIIARHPEQKKYEHGWTNRAESFRL